MFIAQMNGEFSPVLSLSLFNVSLGSLFCDELLSDFAQELSNLGQGLLVNSVSGQFSEGCNDWL
jgi:hypothetical protein